MRRFLIATLLGLGLSGGALAQATNWPPGYQAARLSAPAVALMETPPDVAAWATAAPSAGSGAYRGGVQALATAGCGRAGMFLAPILATPDSPLIAPACARLAKAVHETVMEAPGQGTPRLEDLMRDLGLNWSGYPADLKGRPEAEIIFYRLGVYEDVLRQYSARTGNLPRHLAAELDGLRQQLGAVGTVAAPGATASGPPSASASLSAAELAALSPIDRVFLRNNCRATEDALWQEIKDQYSIGDARTQLLIWSRSPNFNDNYEVLSRDPFEYRWKTGLCADSATVAAAVGTEADPVRADARRQAQALASQQCDSGRGYFPEEALHIRDLDGDGQMDLLLDEMDMICGDGTERSVNCGRLVCVFHIYLWRGTGLQLVKTGWNRLGSIGPGTPPRITLHSHDGGQGAIMWDGRDFTPVGQ